MDKVTWIEVLSRHGDVLSRHRCGAAPILIGRSYRCDIVLDDPYVAPEHVRLRQGDDGRWTAEDLGSVNGVFAGKGRRRLARIEMTDATTIRLGRSHLRLRTADDPVPAERPLPRGGRALPIALAVIATLIGIELTTVWLSETTERSLSAYAGVPLFISLALAFWITIWAILSRVFSGQARVEGHMLVAGIGALAYSLYNEVAWITDFSLASPFARRHAYVALWMILAGTFFWHLRQIGRSRLPLKIGAAVLIAAIGIGFQVLQQRERVAWADMPVQGRRLLPPDLRLAPLNDPASFRADLLSLKQRIDQERRKAPRGADPGAGEDD